MFYVYIKNDVRLMIDFCLCNASFEGYFWPVFRAMKGWVVTLVTAKKHKSCSTRMYVRARESDMGEEMVLCIE